MLFGVYLERGVLRRGEAALGLGLRAECFARKHAGVTVRKGKTSLPSTKLLQEHTGTRCEVQSSYCKLSRLQELRTWSTVPYLHSVTVQP